MSFKKTLVILSYNVWMLDAPFQLGALDVEARGAALPQAISRTGADVIALQEVWSPKHKAQLAVGLKQQGYEYSYYENAPRRWWLRGVFGNGLLIASKIPLNKPEVKNERVMSFNTYTRHDEYFAGKGALNVNLQITPQMTVSFYNTHLGAVSYNPLTRRYNHKHELARQNQAQELFNFIKATHRENPIIVAGDFNAHYKIFSEDRLSHTYGPDHLNLTTYPYSEKAMGLIDSYHALNGEFTDQYTHDADINLYHEHRPVYKFKSPQRTLDYIYVSKNEKLEVAQSQVALTENILIPGRSKALPLSDHFGVLTRIEVS